MQLAVFDENIMKDTFEELKEAIFMGYDKVDMAISQRDSLKEELYSLIENEEGNRKSKMLCMIQSELNRLSKAIIRLIEEYELAESQLLFSCIQKKMSNNFNMAPTQYRDSFTQPI